MRKTKILALCAVFLVLALLAGCGGTENSLFVKDNKADVTFTVNGQGSTPLEGATVQVNSDPNLTGTTDANGRVTIKGVPSNQHATFLVSKIGYDNYQPPSVDSDSSHRWVVVGNTTNNFTVNMVYNGGGQVKVVVQDTLGKSQKLVPVAISNQTTHAVVANRATNMDGIVVLSAAPGTYDLKVAMVGYKVVTQQVTIKKDEVTNVNVTIDGDATPGKIYLNASVLNDDGSMRGGLAAVQVSLPELNTALNTDDSGHAEVKAPAGTYTAVITFPTAVTQNPIVGGNVTTLNAGAGLYQVTVPANGGTGTISVQMSRKPVPLTVSYEVFTFRANDGSALPTGRTDLLLRGSFSDWNSLPVIHATEVSGQPGTYRALAVIPLDLVAPGWNGNTDPHRHQYKLANDSYSVQSGVTLEAGDEDSTTGNAFRTIPLAGSKLQHFEYNGAAGGVVTLRGNFNGWGDENPAIVLKETTPGHYEKDVYFPAGSYMYKFGINGAWENGDNHTFTIN